MKGCAGWGGGRRADAVACGGLVRGWLGMQREDGLVAWLLVRGEAGVEVSARGWWVVSHTVEIEQ